MKKHIWVNNFHNTEAKSTLTPETLDDIEYDNYAGRAAGSDNQKVRRLRKALCPHVGCTCSGFDEMVS